jgi:hypothetical protein
MAITPRSSWAQSYSNPTHSGSGGVAMFMGAKPEAAFYNPSLLMLTDSNESVVITLSSGSVSKSSGFTSQLIMDPKSLLNPFFRYSDEKNYLFEKGPNQLLNSWFGSSNLAFLNTQHLDFITFGLMYKGSDVSFSLNHRLRGTSISQVARGWYDTAFSATNETYLLSRDLHQYATFSHEIGVGFAWEQGLLSGLTGNRSKLYIGVNPKFILPVEYMDSDYTSESILANLGESTIERRHSLHLSGSVNSCTNLTSNPFVCTTTSPNWTSITGFGAGFDAGVTWRFSFGSSIRLRNDLRPVSNYQISVSLAVNDIGFITHKDVKSLSIESEEYTSEKSSLQEIDREYLFTPKSYFDFIGSDIQMLSKSGSIESGSITFLTPTTVTAGIGLELDRLKIGVEVQQHTGNTNSNSDYSSIHFGNGIQIIRYLSIRSGLVLKQGEPVVYTAGFGIDTSFLSVSASTMAKRLSTNNAFRPIMMNVGTLSLKF